MLLLKPPHTHTRVQNYYITQSAITDRLTERHGGDLTFTVHRGFPPDLNAKVNVSLTGIKTATEIFVCDIYEPLTPIAPSEAAGKEQLRVEMRNMAFLLTPEGDGEGGWNITKQFKDIDFDRCFKSF